MIRVVKCGGQVLDDDALLEAFCRDFAAMTGPKVLVHGGGALAGRFQKALGLEPVKYEGRRVTDDATLQVVTMVYAGWCNKRVVTKCVCAEKRLWAAQTVLKMLLQSL